MQAVAALNLVVGPLVVMIRVPVFKKIAWRSPWYVTEGLYRFSHVRLGACALQSCMSATFAFRGKFMGSKFAEPLTGGVFVLETLPEG